MVNRGQLLSATLSVLFNYLTHIYLDRMETLSCECDIDYRGKIMKTLIPLFIFVSCVRLGLGTIPPVVKACMCVVIIIFDVTMFSYLTQLRASKCGCSESARSYLMTDLLYYNYFLFALIVLTNLSMLALVTTTSTIFSPFSKAKA